MDKIEIEAQRYRQLIELADPQGLSATARPRVGLILDNLLRWADEERGRVAPEIDDDERRWRRSPETRPLAETRIDVRTINALEVVGIWTLGDLAALSAKDIENMPNFGPTTLLRVRDVLREFGLELAN